MVETIQSNNTEGRGDDCVYIPHVSLGFPIDHQTKATHSTTTSTSTSTTNQTNSSNLQHPQSPPPPTTNHQPKHKQTMSSTTSTSTSAPVIVRNGTIPGQKIRFSSASAPSTLKVSTVQVVDVSRSTSTDSTADSTQSSSSFRSTLSAFADRFRTNISPAPEKPVSRNHSTARETFENNLANQANYDDDWSVKNGGGLAGARGLGH